MLSLYLDTYKLWVFCLSYPTRVLASTITTNADLNWLSIRLLNHGEHLNFEQIWRFSYVWVGNCTWSSSSKLGWGWGSSTLGHTRTTIKCHFKWNVINIKKTTFWQAAIWKKYFEPQASLDSLSYSSEMLDASSFKGLLDPNEWIPYAHARVGI